MTNGTDVLLIEDDLEDVEITLRAFRKHHKADKIHVVRDRFNLYRNNNSGRSVGHGDLARVDRRR